jgi:hypothetical protein
LLVTQNKFFRELGNYLDLLTSGLHFDYPHDLHDALLYFHVHWFVTESATLDLGVI